MENTENKFKHDGLWYIAVEQGGCRNCAFDTNKPTQCNLDLVEDMNISCSRFYRKDNRSVIFVEIDADNLGDEE